MNELSTNQKIVLKTLEKHKGAYDEAPIITIFELVRKLREEKANSHSTAYHAYINLSKSEEVELLKIFLNDQYDHLGVKL